MSEVKFREFWIQYPDNAFEFMAVKTMMVWQKEIPSYYPDKHVHVIEHEAIAAKDAEIELVRNTYRLELDKLKSELAEKDAVLEFCALGETQWDGVEAMHKAREVLQKFLPERNNPNATTK